MTDRDAAMREALAACLEWMERLRASGDAGFWEWAADEYTRGIAALAIPAPEPVAPPQQAGVTEAMAAELEDARYKADYWKRMHDEVRAALTAALSARGGEAAR